MQRPAQRIAWNPALEGIRGCAVLLVLMYHFLQRADPNRGLRAVLFKIGAGGWSGVDLFFVLSGYLITSILLRSKPSPNYFGDFYSRRIRRIFPLYYGVLAIILLIVPNLDHLRTPAVSRVLHDQWYFWLYISNFMPRSSSADWLSAGHFWSLAIEEQFYLLWPAIVYWSSRRRAMIVAGSGIALSIALRTVFQWWAFKDPTMDVARHWAFAWTPCRLDSLGVGALIALLSTETESRRILEKIARIAAIVVFPLFAWFLWRGKLVDVLGGAPEAGALPLLVLIYTFLAIAYGTIVVEATRADRTWLTPVMAARPLRFLGKYSYGIYVIQGILAPTFERYLPHPRLVALTRSGDAAVYLFFAITTSIVIAISMLSWHAYEKRFLAPSGVVIPPPP